MTHAIMTAVWPSSIEPLQAAILPIDPPALAAYTLLAGFVALVWLGNRTSGENQGEGGGDDASPSAHREGEGEAAMSGKTQVRLEGGRSGPKGKRRRLSQAQRRRKGHINWIQ